MLALGPSTTTQDKIENSRQDQNFKGSDDTILKCFTFQNGNNKFESENFSVFPWTMILITGGNSSCRKSDSHLRKKICLLMRKSIKDTLKLIKGMDYFTRYFPCIVLTHHRVAQCLEKSEQYSSCPSELGNFPRQHSTKELLLVIRQGQSLYVHLGIFSF